MSEIGIAQAVQATLQGMDAFADDDVVIDEYGILDQSTLNAPYTIIGVSDDFISLQQTRVPDTTWFIPVMLVVRFVDWPTSLGEFRLKRQAIIDEFNEVGTNRSPGADGTIIVNAERIRNAGPVFEQRDKWTEDSINIDPNYLAQTLVLEVREH